MRKITNLNENWQFTGPAGTSSPVHLPHTWNNLDGQDGGDDYWRGSCMYERELPLPDFNGEEEQVYLEFRGVNASAKVSVNGKQVVEHDGGYSTFRVNVTDVLQEQNNLRVQVDNSVNDRVYPQKADFTFYGGIYRDVNLIVLNKYHFAMDYYGGNGIKITPEVKGNTGCVRIETFTEGAQLKEEVEIHVDIEDEDGNLVASGIGADATLMIPKVHLWDGLKDPYQYSAKARLLVDGKQVDTVQSRFGVRSFFVDAEKGFFLNGRSYPLRGVTRHQDWKGLGNAITKEHHNRDMELIREIGANCIRLAHYQHDQYFYDLCDRYGIVVWAEIPYISEHMPNARANTISQMKELITQNYNHPSIVNWGVSNEITISTKNKKDMLENHRILNDLCHKMDATRFTALACYAVCGPFNRSAHITDVVSWNLYLGWYVPGLFLNDLWMKFFHFAYPKRSLGYSEYGCEAMTNLHSSKPRRGDHTEEYQMVYHEFMLKCFERNSYLWATHVWNLFDFAADARDQGGEPGMNHKGLVTFDRKIKKDSFYLYKAYWSEEPFIHLCGSRYTDRVEEETEVTVYSNQKTVTLYVNGTEAATQTGNKVFRFKVPLGAVGTITTVGAVGGSCNDDITLVRTDRVNPDYILQKKKSTSANWV